MPLNATNGESNLDTTLTMSQGETGSLQLTLTSNGTAINLTGYDVKMQINFLTPLLLDIANSGITFVGAPTAGIVQINIADTVSENFAVGSFSYDLFIISAGGLSTRLIGGVFNVLQSVTPIP